jgi:hypothetical protein
MRRTVPDLMPYQRILHDRLSAGRCSLSHRYRSFDASI